MFGYVIPDKPEMKVKEYELFRAFYCGICKQMGRRSGGFSRLALNYDCTFLGLILTAVSDLKPVLVKKRCLLNPFKKLNVIQSPVIDYAADMNVLLAYHKLKDDIRDERDIKSMGLWIFFFIPYKRLKRKYPDICHVIEENLRVLRFHEKSGSEALDEVCEPFCNIMEKIFSRESFIKDKSMVQPLKWMGYNLGKWIYLLDAYDDIPKDLKSKSYNPIIARYKEEHSSEAVKERMKILLFYSLDQVVKAWNLLSIDKVQGIVENIMCQGMFNKTVSVLKLEEEGGRAEPAKEYDFNDLSRK